MLSSPAGPATPRDLQLASLVVPDKHMLEASSSAGVASPARLLSHEARGVAELRARDERVKKVAATPGHVLIVEDWRMKVLSLPFREGMFYICPHRAVSFCLSLTPSLPPLMLRPHLSELSSAQAAENTNLLGSTAPASGCSTNTFGCAQ